MLLPTLHSLLPFAIHHGLFHRGQEFVSTNIILGRSHFGVVASSEVSATEPILVVLDWVSHTLPGIRDRWSEAKVDIVDPSIHAWRGTAADIKALTVRRRGQG